MVIRRPRPTFLAYYFSAMLALTVAACIVYL